MESQPEHHGIDEAKLRSIVHEMRTHLFVLDLGARALDGARGDSAQFAAVVARIKDDGVEPMKRAVDALADLYNEREL